MTRRHRILYEMKLVMVNGRANNRWFDSESLYSHIRVTSGLRGDMVFGRSQSVIL